MNELIEKIESVRDSLNEYDSRDAVVFEQPPIQASQLVDLFDECLTALSKDDENKFKLEALDKLLMGTPELNMSNYDEGQVDTINAALMDAYLILNPPTEPNDSLAENVKSAQEETEKLQKDRVVPDKVLSEKFDI